MTNEQGRDPSWGYSAESEQGLLGALLLDNTV